MEDVKRWSVTYTKHLKQKRKVYQDGLLDLHTSENKLFLYDDCAKLLECRVLKKDEVVSCGETLTFNAYLVDVNVAEGDHKPRASSGKDCKIVGKIKSIPTLSPSQKIIRDFKKREVQKYATKPTMATSPDVLESNTGEWEVLYTTQVTQKAKKYHDGSLQLLIRGSFGRQVMLYDATRNLLDSRFLKKDEIIESGEAIALDAHLVEIGEQQVDQKCLKENNGNAIKETGMVHGEHCGAHVKKFVEKGFIKNEFNIGTSHSSRDTTRSSTKEWNVMYTAQLTQKAKKYHGGFLKLANCGLRGRQVMLYDLTRKLIDSRFLKKEELVQSGESLAFGAHLVEIGESEVKKEPPDDLNVQGKSLNVLHKTGKMHSQQEHHTVRNIVYKGKSHQNSCSKEDAETKLIFFNVDKTNASRRTPMDKPLRNASQILSTLQKPRAQITMVEGDMNDSTKRSICLKKEPPFLDAIDLHFLEVDQPRSSSLAHHESSEHEENADARESKENTVLERLPDVTSSRASSSVSSSQLVISTDSGNSHQLFSDNTEAGIRRDEANVSNIAKSEELTSAREMVEGPSFNLGF